MSLFDLTGKVILVTGGYGHLGKHICKGLADYGASVYVLARSEDKFTAAFGKDSSNIAFAQCDVSSTESVRAALKAVSEQENGIDVLVNNAVYLRGRHEISDEDWAFTMDGVLGNFYRCIREVIPYLRKRGKGKIINVSSMYGMVSPDFAVYESAPQFLNPPHYGVAKAGVIQLTKYFAKYLGADNITVNAVSPGPFPSAKVQNEREFIDALEKKTALGRIGKPEDLEGAFVFLCSDSSAYITGHNLVIDGGWTIT